MKKITVQIKNKAGLHARPSSLFVQLASTYDSDIKVRFEGEEINGKSIMGLMLLAAEQGRTLELEADGPDEVEMLYALRILVVEDNELNREIVKAVLEETGFEVEEAENGAVAVDKIKTAGALYYDVVLMDIQMPVMDGYMATKKIRSLEDSDLANIPIIALSANAFEEDRKASADAGMNGHLAKPVNVSELLKMLCKLF